MLTAQGARTFATSWIAAWNAHDIERILSHYCDDFEMVSPLIVSRMGVPSGVLKGKAAVRPYWEIGLAAEPPLRFELLDVFVGIDSVVIYYDSFGRNRVAELFYFNADGLVTRAASHHASSSKVSI